MTETRTSDFSGWFVVMVPNAATHSRGGKRVAYEIAA